MNESRNDGQSRDRDLRGRTSPDKKSGPRPRSLVTKVSSNEEYDPEKMFKSAVLSSQVHVPPRKISLKSEESSGKKKILLKAVEDADRSITQRRAEKRQKTTELEEIHAKRMKATLAAKKVQSKKKPPSPVPSSSSSSSSESEDDLRLRLEERRRRNKKPADDNDAELENIRQRALNSMIQNQQQKKRDSSEKKILIPLNDESSDEELSLSSNGEENLRKTNPMSNPKFIVTLDGINSSYFKKDSSSSSSDKYKNKATAIIAPMMKDVSEIESFKKDVPKVEIEEKVVVRKRISPPPPSDVEKVTIPTAVQPVKKIRQRITAPVSDPKPSPAAVTAKEVCKFWPRCKRGDACIYLHPKSRKPVLNVNAPLPDVPKDKFKWTPAIAK